MTQIYLISPPKIELKDFSIRLNSALKTGLVPVFQLRLKDYKAPEVNKISRELQKVCQDNKCLFLINDYFDIALDIGADGVHLGLEDESVLLARKKSPQNFIIGASCYDSRHLAIEACEQGADYISFGAFFQSKTKKSRGNPTTEIITWSKDLTDLPIVAIGGIDDQNCGILSKSGADFVSVISYVWDHLEGEAEALKKLQKSLVF
jgi:thiamine-phosphate pyrophosphorylase